MITEIVDSTDEEVAEHLTFKDLECGAVFTLEENDIEIDALQPRDVLIKMDKHNGSHTVNCLCFNGGLLIHITNDHKVIELEGKFFINKVRESK